MADPLARRAADLRDYLHLAARDLKRLAQKAEAARAQLSAQAGSLEIYGAGALVHGYYTHLERVFERIVRDLNSAPLEGPDWHRRLMRSMTLERPGVRPALLTPELADRLDEVLRFRHLFRNLYVLDLEAAKVLEVLDRTVGLHPELLRAIERFGEFLSQVALG